MDARCLMLDVDGVLIDGRPRDGKPWKTDLLADLGVSPERLSEAFFQGAWSDIVEGRKTLKPTLTAALAHMGAPVGADELIAYWFENDARIVASVLSDCQTARAEGLPIYLTTNQEHERAAFLMEVLDLGAHVDGIVYSAQAGFRKPHPEFYSYAQGRTGLRPQDLLLVDDTPANIEGAHAAGWAAVLWDGRETLLEILHRSVGR